jgi:glycosyltransferase involved in cell wall biosynthesis
MHPRAGGPPTVVENFVRELGQLGHHSEIVSTALYCQGDQAALLDRLNRLAPTTFLPRQKLGTFFYSAVARRMLEIIRNVDIVHVHTLWNPINLQARRACTQYRRPYVLMPHGMLDPYSLSVRRWRKAAYLGLIERSNLAAASRVIYTTAAEGRLATSAIPSLPPSVVISLGSDGPVDKAEALAGKFVAAFPKARGRRQLLFLGRLHEKKGLDRILQSLPQIRLAHSDILLSIVGDGHPSFVATLKATIDRLDLASHVLMTGMLEGPLKWGAYASAELFLLPSRQENFAIAIAEAMQFGVPVVISNKVNTWPSVIEAKAGIVLDETGIEGSLSKSIEALLDDHAARRDMGRRAQEYARQNFNWGRSAKSLVACYEEVLAGGAKDN